MSFFSAPSFYVKLDKPEFPLSSECQCFEGSLKQPPAQDSSHEGAEEGPPWGGEVDAEGIIPILLSPILTVQLGK